jgi:hypothetical protein
MPDQEAGACGWSHSSRLGRRGEATEDAWHKMDKVGPEVVNCGRARVEMSCGRYPLQVVVMSISNPARLESTSLAGAQMFVGDAGGFTAELPKLPGACRDQPDPDLEAAGRGRRWTLTR